RQQSISADRCSVALRSSGYNNKNNKRDSPMKKPITHLLATTTLASAILLQTGCSHPESEEPIVRRWDWNPLASLSYLAEQVLTLYSHNFIASNGEYPANVEGSEDTLAVRTAEGNCNDLQQNRMGSTGIRF